LEVRRDDFYKYGSRERCVYKNQKIEDFLHIMQVERGVFTKNQKIEEDLLHIMEVERSVFTKNQKIEEDFLHIIRVERSVFTKNQK